MFRLIRYPLALMAFLLLCWGAQAQSFDQYFADSTLRIDYVFAGSNATTLKIYPEELNLLQGWHGRKAHLDSLALNGTGQITMRDRASGKVIYRTSFSSLFQEWLSTDEANRVERAYENVYLLPYPKNPVTVDIRLENIHRKVIAQHSFEVDPRDILIHSRVRDPKPDYEYLHRGNKNLQCIDVVILAEGYDRTEMGRFMRDARKATKALLAHEPFRSKQNYFNIIAVKTPSLDSGISLPRQKDWKTTAFGSHFDTFYSERYLTTRRVKTIHNALTQLPYEHIIILANTETYGGGGIFNSYTLSYTGGKFFEPVVVHEFGHSFGGLADEYAYEQDTMTDTYPRDIEPWEQNVTNLKDFTGKKWQPLIRRGVAIPTPVEDKKKVTIGAFEGAAYSLKGFYRCSYDCRMRTNSVKEFCPACRKALTELIEYYTDEPRVNNQGSQTSRAFDHQMSLSGRP